MKPQALGNWLVHHKLPIVLVLLAISASTWAWRSSRSHAQLTELSETVSRGLLLESVYGIGTVAANKSFSLKLGVASTVKALYVKEGDQVKRGQKLVDLEGVGSFSSPLKGTVTYLPFRVGETVFPQAIVLNLVDLEDRYLTVSLEQRGALRVRKGQRAQISFDSLRDRSFKGQVEALYANEGNFFVRIATEDLLPSILPGMTADVAIIISERDKVLLAPVAALSQGKVYVRDEQGEAKEIEVKTGLVDGSRVEILSGDLQEGARLFVPPGTKR